MKETVRGILEGRRGGPEVSVITTTRSEFRQWALMAQSFAGQAARYGVTPNGRSLDYRPEREPTPDEIRELTIWSLRMTERHLADPHLLTPFVGPATDSGPAESQI